MSFILLKIIILVIGLIAFLTTLNIAIIHFPGPLGVKQEMIMTNAERIVGGICLIIVIISILSYVLLFILR